MLCVELSQALQTDVQAAAAEPVESCVPAPCYPHGSYGNKDGANGSKAQTSYQGPKGFFLGTPFLSFAPMANY